MNFISQATRLKSSAFFYLFSLFVIAGCGGQSNPPANSPLSAGAPAGLEARIFVGNTNGTLSVIEHDDAGNTLAEPIDLFSSVGDMASSTKNHIFVNLGSTNQVAALDPVGEEAVLKKFIAVGQRPVHSHRDPEGTRIWILNDGDSSTGIDTVTSACNTAKAASVSVIQNHGTAGHGADEEEGNAGEVLKTICVGKGHHRIAFSAPSETAPSVPLRAFVSNIKDGTITVIDNDPGAEASPNPNYLTVIGTIDLCNPAKETCPPATASGAGPHGMVYSPVSGKIYNNNEAHGTVNVINAAADPVSAIEATLDIQFADSVYLTPDGRFVIVRGLDTTAVTGKLTVIDVSNNNPTTVDLPLINAGALAFTSDGKKLYVGSSGSTQRPTQRGNVVLVYDTSALPALPTPKEITVGSTAAGRSIGLLEHDGEAEFLYVTNRADGTVSVIDAKTDTAIDTLQVGGTPTSLLVFPMEGDLSH
jgi:YVTN family beta-propeller protein